jgi:hypothetical protein
MTAFDDAGSDEDEVCDDEEEAKCRHHPGIIIDVRRM